MTNETETILHAEALRREAVGFAEWLKVNAESCYYDGEFDWCTPPFTSEGLYDLYLKSKANTQKSTNPWPLPSF